MEEAIQPAQDQRLLRLADLAEPRQAVRGPAGDRAAGGRRARVPRPARRRLPLLRSLRPARDGVPVAGHRARAHRPGPQPRAGRAARTTSTRSTARCSARSPTSACQVGQEGPGEGPKDKPNSDAGFQNSLREPDQYSQGANQQPLPPAGPARARAAVLSLARPRASRRGVVSLRVTCPPRWLSKMAAGLPRHGARPRRTSRAAPRTPLPDRRRALEGAALQAHDPPSASPSAQRAA